MDHTYLRYIKVNELTAAQRRAMNKELQQQKRAIQAALKLVNNSLARLAKVKGQSRKKS